MAQPSLHTNKKHLATSTRVEAWDFTFPPAPADALPNEVFDKEKTLHLNDSCHRPHILWAEPTDGDISTFFVKQMSCTAVTRGERHYPFIDYSTGGNITGMIKSAETNLARVTDKSIIIPGHGIQSAPLCRRLCRDRATSRRRCSRSSATRSSTIRAWSSVARATTRISTRSSRAAFLKRTGSSRRPSSPVTGR